MNHKIIAFDGRKYRKGPTGYYHAENWGSGPTTLHRAIWEKEKGEIPAGHHIHHKDGDKGNNDISNLELISASDHARMHAAENEWVGSPENREQIIKAGEKAKEWHASEDGKKWHSEHAKKGWEVRGLSEVRCQETDCGAAFMTPYPTRARFCSSACKERTRQRNLGKKLAPRRGPYKGSEYAKQS